MRTTMDEGASNDCKSKKESKLEVNTIRDFKEEDIFMLNLESEDVSMIQNKMSHDFKIKIQLLVAIIEELFGRAGAVEELMKRVLKLFKLGKLLEQDSHAHCSKTDDKGNQSYAHDPASRENEAVIHSDPLRQTSQSRMRAQLEVERDQTDPFHAHIKDFDNVYRGVKRAEFDQTSTSKKPSAARKQRNFLEDVEELKIDQRIYDEEAESQARRRRRGNNESPFISVGSPPDGENLRQKTSEQRKLKESAKASNLASREHPPQHVFCITVDQYHVALFAVIIAMLILMIFLK